MKPRDTISVLVPARNEEGTLPVTLPTIVRAASELPGAAEVVVIAPTESPVHSEPPVRDPILRWVPVDEPGKFRALRAGADAARGHVLVMVDADVVVEPSTFTELLRPMTSHGADIVAGRIDLLRHARTPTGRMLEQWSSISMAAWDQFRREQPDFRWALPGAIYAIKRPYVPEKLLVPLVDDASIGLHAIEQGASFAYAPDAAVRTPAPASYVNWMRQKFRSRRGWAGLAKFRQVEVTNLERTFRRYLTVASQNEPTSWLMHTQDRLHRLAAKVSITLAPSASGAWEPARRNHQWSQQCPSQQQSL